MNPAIIKILIGLLTAANLASFTAYFIDKTRARKDLSRISEARLLQFSFVGPIGSIFGIWWIRHKTQKSSYLVKYCFVMLLSIICHSLIGYLLSIFS